MGVLALPRLHYHPGGEGVSKAIAAGGPMGFAALRGDSFAVPLLRRGPGINRRPCHCSSSGSQLTPPFFSLYLVDLIGSHTSMRLGSFLDCHLCNDSNAMLGHLQLQIYSLDVFPAVCQLCVHLCVIWYRSVHGKHTGADTTRTDTLRWEKCSQVPVSGGGRLCVTEG